MKTCKFTDCSLRLTHHHAAAACHHASWHELSFASVRTRESRALLPGLRTSYAYENNSCLFVCVFLGIGKRRAHTGYTKEPVHVPLSGTNGAEHADHWPGYAVACRLAKCGCLLLRLKQLTLHPKCQDSPTLHTGNACLATNFLSQPPAHKQAVQLSLASSTFVCAVRCAA